MKLFTFPIFFSLLLTGCSKEPSHWQPAQSSVTVEYVEPDLDSTTYNTDPTVWVWNGEDTDTVSPGDMLYIEAISQDSVFIRKPN